MESYFARLSTSSHLDMGFDQPTWALNIHYGLWFNSLHKTTVYGISTKSDDGMTTHCAVAFIVHE